MRLNEAAVSARSWRAVAAIAVAFGACVPDARPYSESTHQAGGAAADAGEAGSTSSEEGGHAGSEVDMAGSSGSRTAGDASGGTSGAAVRGGSGGIDEMGGTASGEAGTGAGGDDADGTGPGGYTAGSSGGKGAAGATGGSGAKSGAGGTSGGSNASGGSGDPVTLASSLSEPITIAVDDTHVFFGCGDGTLRRVAVDGGTPELLASTQVTSAGSGTEKDLPLTLDTSFVYWASLDGEVRRVPRAGGELPTDITSFALSGFERPTAIAVSGASLYVAVSSPVADTGYVSRVAVSDGTKLTIASAQRGTHGIATDGAEVFWAAISDFLSGRPAIRKVSVAGGAITDLYLQGSFASSPRSSLAIAGASVYWADDYSVLGLAKSGGPPTTIVGAGSMLCCQWVAVDGSSVYWSDDQGTSIMKRRASGGDTPETLASNQAKIMGMAVDDSHVYWLDDPGGGAGVLRKTPK